MDEEVINHRSRLIDCLAVDDKINCIDVKTTQKQHIIIMIGCKNGDIIQWEFNMNEPSAKNVKKVMSGESECVQLKYHYNGLSVAACFDTKMILIDCLTTMSLFCFSKQYITCLEWLSDYILIGDSAGRVSMINLTNGNVLYEFESHGKLLSKIITCFFDIRHFGHLSLLTSVILKKI